MNFEFLYKGATHSVDVKDNRLITFADSAATIEIERRSDGRLFIVKGNSRREVCAVVAGEKTFVDIDGVVYEFAQPSQDTALPGGEGGDSADPSKVFAPMPGKIVKLMVVEGDEVAERQQLVIVEAMKMENVVIAKAAGIVSAVNFAEGAQVDTEHPIIELELGE